MTYSVSPLSALSQFPNVSFGSKKYKYGNDDLSPYDSYRGPQPPEIELRKYNLSKSIQQNIEEKDYLSAIRGKLTLAEICKTQHKEDDAYMPEESIRRLYKDLPKYQRNDVKSAISCYNPDIAQYIDEDIQ